ncbi:MAG: hypothetical protein L0Y44_14670 [Phycisphaerales bacterium]|nr:hypothetical protein [Phycisphaerales bacterium]MCI0631885.1 hypothetical protein [Phycisphaerales bacterium]MCI0676741.1 hypothetical protein [Phycisphaerales bacterium]
MKSHNLSNHLARIICLGALASPSILITNQSCLGDAYEGFVYAPALPVNGLNGGTGWNIAWLGTVAAQTGFATLTHALALPSAGVALRTIDPATATREFHSATGAIAGTGRPWMSFLFQREQANPMTLEMLGFFVDPLKITILASGTVTLQYGLNPAVVSTSSASGPFVTDLYLLRLTPSSIDLWVNPPAALGPPHASVSAPVNINYQTVDFTFGYGQTLDEIRTGPTLGSVAAAQAPCPGDITPPPGGDGLVNVADLLMVISNWGPCPPGAPCLSDVAPAGGDGLVNVADLLLVISKWGECP